MLFLQNISLELLCPVYLLHASGLLGGAISDRNIRSCIAFLVQMCSVVWYNILRDSLSIVQMFHKLTEAGPSQCLANKKGKPILRIYVYACENKLLIRSEWKEHNIVNLPPSIIGFLQHDGIWGFVAGVCCWPFRSFLAVGVHSVRLLPLQAELLQLYLFMRTLAGPLKDKVSASCMTPTSQVILFT